ncbi:hypothetical protein ACFQ77_08490 [Streptomyces virginiae]|uniref:hypothetical protein n=1 Tax=Streptomyces virginiae TaxID=1961 RepID=UPI0036C33A4B
MGDLEGEKEGLGGDASVRDSLRHTSGCPAVVGGMPTRGWRGSRPKLRRSTGQATVGWAPAAGQSIRRATRSSGAALGPQSVGGAGVGSGSPGVLVDLLVEEVGGDSDQGLGEVGTVPGDVDEECAAVGAVDAELVDAVVPDRPVAEVADRDVEGFGEGGVVGAVGCEPARPVAAPMNVAKRGEGISGRVMAGFVDSEGKDEGG